MDRAFETSWACGGHPPLVLPCVLDGVELAETSNYADIIARAVIDPPFVAPGFKGAAFWVKRLYRIMPTAELKAKVGAAVARQLWNSSATAVHAAIEFYRANSDAAGGEQLAQAWAEDRSRLLALKDPDDEEHSLYEDLLEAVTVRLMDHRSGLVKDVAALELAKAALLGGEEIDMLIYQVAACDPPWFAQHAVEVATVRRGNRERVVQALSYLPEASREEAIAALSQISQNVERRIRSWAREHGVRLEPRAVKSPGKGSR